MPDAGGEAGRRLGRVALGRVAALRGLLVLCLIFFVAIAARPGDAMAQAPSAAAPLTITQVDFGFGPLLAAERWQPVVVWIASDRAINGVVSLEFQQDGSQSARVEASFATTPGKTIPVELVIAPPHRLARVTLRVSGGPREIRRVYTQMPDENEYPMPPVQSEAILIANIGETGAEKILATFSRVTPDSLMVTDGGPVAGLEQIAPVSPLPNTGDDQVRAADRWRQQIVAPVLDPALVPIAWKAWDAAAAVVVRAPTLESMDERRRAALMTWVEAGGRLVVVMDPTTAWTLGAAFPGDPLPVDAAPVERWSVTDGEAFAMERDVRPIELRGRAMSLTPTGQREGWRLGWPVTREAQPARGMLATGPVGMGIVTLLGVEPGFIPSRVSAEAEGSLWEQVLIGDSIGLLPMHRGPDVSGDVNMGSWWYAGSGEDTQSAHSVVVALDLAARGLSVPQGVFLLVGLSMVALSVLIGPLDFIVFRRRGLGGRTWLTAMIWIGLATVGAYVLPGLTRSSQSAVRRVEVLDMLAIGSAASGETLDVRTYETAITGLFSVRSQSWAESQEGGGRWWRGVSTTPLGYSGEASIGAFQPLRTRLAGSEGDVALRRTAITSLSMPQFTFRGLMDSSPGRGREMRVRVTPKGASEMVIRVEGVAPGARLVAASLMRPWELPVGMVGEPVRGDGAIEVTFPASRRESGAVPGEAWSGFGQGLGLVGSPQDATSSEGSSLSSSGLGALPGLRERGDAIMRRVHQFDVNAPEDGSGYACLFLELDEASEGSGVRLPLVTSGGVALNRNVLMRVLVPWSRAKP